MFQGHFISRTPARWTLFGFGGELVVSLPDSAERRAPPRAPPAPFGSVIDPAINPSGLGEIKKKVSLVWAISRRNVVIGKYLPRPEPKLGFIRGKHSKHQVRYLGVCYLFVNAKRGVFLPRAPLRGVVPGERRREPEFFFP